MPRPVNQPRAARRIAGSVLLLVLALASPAWAFTPTPPPPTPTPTATPTRLCVAPANGQTRLQSRITVNTNADASEVSLSWGIAGSTGGFPDLCVTNPTEWDLFVDDLLVAHVSGNLGGAYRLTGLTTNTVHTFKVVPTNNANLSTLTRTIEIVPGYTDPPFVPTPDVTPTPTPTPPPPTPTPTPTPTPQVCLDPPPPPLHTEPWTFFSPGEITDTTLTFRWQAPYGCYPLPVKVSLVVNGQPVPTTSTGVSGTETLTGLSPSTTYSFAVSVTDASGKVTPVVANSMTTKPAPTPTPEPPTPTPTPEPTDIAAAFAGQGSLLVRTAGLAGTFAATNAVNLTLPASGTGAIEGSLSGFTRSGTVMLGGLFPAKTSLTYSGSALTGTSAAGRVTATAGGTLAFGRTTILGITLTAGTACRTVSDVRMALAGPVTADGGGKLAGTVTLPRFSGCNTLGTFLGTTAAKSAISLALTPAPVATS